MKTSVSQFQLLVDYMQKHGDLSKPNDGPHGKALNIRQWSEITNLLNADGTGDTKSLEKWRKVWSDLKNNTKKKSARIHKAARGTGGGPACTLKLSDLEQRVLTIIGSRAATGILEIPEVGLEEEVTELAVLPTDAQTIDDSPSIFVIGEQLRQQTCSDFEDWNRPGTSAQATVIPPVDRSNLDSVAREEPETVSSLVADEPASQTEREAAGGVPRAAVQSTAAPLAAPATPPLRSAGRAPQEPTLAAPATPPLRSAGRAPQEPTLAAPATPPLRSAGRAPQEPTPLPPTPRRRRLRPPTNLSPAGRRTRTQTQSDLARQAFVRSDCEWRTFQQETERRRLNNEERWLDLFGEFIALGHRLVNILEKQ